ETFGEKPFSPKAVPEAPAYCEEQRELALQYDSRSGQITNEYIKGEERSFTIIAYPVPEIGPKYEEIFDEVIRINTLDAKLYEKDQQTMIDALDQGEKVRVIGKGENRTDMEIRLWSLKDARKETIFENCVADVNIPVGEVFTSPVLKGTTGKLFVSQVYLNELKYLNLEIDFEDGVIRDYTCTNFEKEEECRKYIKENVLMNHETLPMGEFAIGTNTTAYRMARDFDIADKLPILIAEKTGPHFAVGDTCYSHEEDMVTYNPDGKQIVARENDFSKLRSEDMSKAYFNCHTDITIPYDELDKITVIRKDGTTEDIISDGRFVLAGIEELNKPLDR
ncbi:MAG: aminopeptidase, partial [Roseburia sp.]|nr:aminopeptidase [Roseburia sp.]